MATPFHFLMLPMAHPLTVKSYLISELFLLFAVQQPLIVQKRSCSGANIPNLTKRIHFFLQDFQHLGSLRISSSTRRNTHLKPLIRHNHIILIAVGCSPTVFYHPFHRFIIFDIAAIRVMAWPRLTAKCLHALFFVYSRKVVPISDA